jgi:hypothetical protein
MMDRRFDANAVAADVGPRLWRYLSAHSTPTDVVAVAESLFDLPPNELTRLTAAHLAESDATGRMLEAAPRILRNLPSSVERAEIETRGRIQQPVLWPRTYERQIATEDRSRFVCRPPERAYDTPLGRLMAASLDRCADLQSLAGLKTKGALGSKVAQRAGEARRLRGHAKLRDVRKVNGLPDRTLVSLRRHREALPLIDWARLAAAALDDQSPSVIREVIQERLLPPSQASRLFELFVGFRLLDALSDAGFVEDGVRLLPNSAIPLARLRRGPASLEVYWQRPLWAVADVPDKGRYREALEDAGLGLSPLRPDFVLRMRNPDRLAFVEVKLSVIDKTRPDRRGILDALLYAHDAEALFAGLPHPHGLVVAWNALGRPASGRFVVADQSRIGDATNELLSAWAA